MGLEQSMISSSKARADINMSGNTSIRSAASFLSLPTELLTQVALHCDRPTALSLARVARACTAPSDHLIWRHLDLSLESDAIEDSHPSMDERKRASERRGQDLRSMVKRIMLAGDARRLGMVESVEAAPRAAANSAILAILDLVSPTLRDLHFSADSLWQENYRDTIDFRLIDHGLHFPALTSLTIRAPGIQYSQSVILICLAAPNLITLNAGIWVPDEIPDFASYYPLPADYSSKLSLTKLRELWLDFDQPDLECFDTLVSVIECSPKLEKLELCTSFERDDVAHHLMTILGGKQHLCHLRLNIGLHQFFSRFDLKGATFTSLRRLCLWSEDTLDLFRYLPTLPSLEILEISLRDRSPIWRSTSPVIPLILPRFAAMPPAFAQQLRDCPYLAVINCLDDAREKYTKGGNVSLDGALIGTIWSCVHDNEEVLHARLLFDYAAVPVDADPIGGPDGGTDGTTDQPPADVAGRARTYVRSRKEEWRDFTDYDGYEVPLAVLEEMRAVQGATLEEWQGRGVEVGEKAWKVLMDWRKAREEQQ